MALLQHLMPLPRQLRHAAVSATIPALGIALFTTMSASKPTPPPTLPTTFPTRPYTPRHASFPYTPHDFLRQDESPDTDFYSQPRFVTHIDEPAIALLKSYYTTALPRQGRILDLCSSWTSHFPPELEAAAAHKTPGGSPSDQKDQGLEVIGLGLNDAELASNPVLRTSHLVDLNASPALPRSLLPLDATTCVVSIDYLTQPLAVLSSLYQGTKAGGTVHLVVSNRCFPTKAVGRWLRVGEEERLQMVGDYLWWSGWRGVEIVELQGGKARGSLGLGGGDPLWVVRGRKLVEGKSEEEGTEARSEL